MGKIILDDNCIKSLPTTTSRIEAPWDKGKFSAEYSTVPYYSTDPEWKNLAYKQPGNVPSTSVTGIKNRWGARHLPPVRLFILTARGKEQEVLSSPRAHSNIKVGNNTLGKYKDKLQQRITASLAINSLGKKKNSNMMCNDGSLPIYDDKSSGARKSRKESVCLKMGVNEYMNLVAQITSLSSPFNGEDLLGHGIYVFQISKDLDGEFWFGQPVKPIIIKGVKSGEYDLKKFFIQGKNLKDNKSLVPYWLYNAEDYAHERLYIIWQVIGFVNGAFKGILDIKFIDSQIIHYGECKAKGGILALVQEYLAGRSISFEDPFQTNGSKSVIPNFKNEAQEIMSGFLTFPEKPTPDDTIIKLYEPRKEGCEVTRYSQPMIRLSSNGNVLQHITYYDDGKLDLLSTPSMRRILIELIVKDSLARRIISKPLANMPEEQNTIRYKINQSSAHGASLKIDSQGSIDVE